MRSTFDILRELRSILGMGDEITKHADNINKIGLLTDVQYLCKTGQIGNTVFENWLKSLGENPNDYYSLTGKKK